LPGWVDTVLVDIVVFEGADELDVIGPLEVMRRAGVLGADVRTRLCSREACEWVSGAFGLRFQPDSEFAPGEADVVVVPGGGWVARNESGAWGEVKQGELPRLLAAAAEAGALMAGVCTGSLLLAHAGIVGRCRATTHRDAWADLAGTGATVVGARVVDAGRVVTSGGVTSGIDLALWLVCRYFGDDLARTVAEGLEYAWEPAAVDRAGRPEAPGATEAPGGTGARGATGARGPAVAGEPGT
jgi:transcriptional regulator GlxA family with amidase domain